MSSFTRGDYERVYRFAKMVYTYFEARDRDMEKWCSEIFDMVEGVLGQQTDRPDMIGPNAPRRRRKFKVKT